MLEGRYYPIGEPQQSLNGNGTVIKNGYRNVIPVIDEHCPEICLENWEKGLAHARLEKEKEIVYGPNTKFKQLDVDSVQISEGIKGHNAGKKTLKFKQNGCTLVTLDFKDKVGIRKVIAMLQDIKASGKNFSIDQLSYILKNLRK